MSEVAVPQEQGPNVVDLAGPGGTIFIGGTSGGLISLNGDTTPAQVLVPVLPVTIVPDSPGTLVVSVEVFDPTMSGLVPNPTGFSDCSILGRQGWRRGFSLINGRAAGVYLTNGTPVILTTVTIPVGGAGGWLFIWGAGLAGISGGSMDVGLSVNGNPINSASQFLGMSETDIFSSLRSLAVNGSALLILAEGDTVAILMTHTGGGDTLSLDASIIGNIINLCPGS
jgi:hypothetical protein